MELQHCATQLRLVHKNMRLCSMLQSRMIRLCGKRWYGRALVLVTQSLRDPINAIGLLFQNTVNSRITYKLTRSRVHKVGLVNVRQSAYYSEKCPSTKCSIQINFYFYFFFIFINFLISVFSSSKVHMLKYLKRAFWTILFI